MRANKTIKNTFQDAMIWAIQGSATELEYNTNMDKLKLVSPTAHTYLENLTAQKWCKWPYMKTHSLFEHRTSNFVESCNAAIMLARGESAYKAVQKMQIHVMKEVSDRRTKAAARAGKGETYTFFADGKLKAAKRQSMYYNVDVSTNDLAYVTHSEHATGPRRTVNLAADADVVEWCSCLSPKQMMLPCVHMFAAAQKLERLTQVGAPLFFEKYVHKGYLLKNYLDTLNDVALTLVDTESLVPDGVMGVNVPVLQAGRPRKKRIRSAGENPETGARPKVYRCGLCGQPGHTRKRCMQKGM